MYWFYVQENSMYGHPVFQACSGVFITLLEMLRLILNYVNIPAYQNSAIYIEDLNNDNAIPIQMFRVENWLACILNNAIYCNDKIQHISDMPLKCNSHQRKHAIITIWANMESDMEIKIVMIFQKASSDMHVLYVHCWI